MCKNICVFNFHIYNYLFSRYQKHINLQSFKSSTMPLKEDSYKPYSEVTIGSIIYDTIGVFLDKVQNMSIEFILFSRFFGFCIIFIYLLFSRGLRQLRLRKNSRYLMLLGLLNAITSICYFSSIKYSGISVAVLLLYIAPVYVNLLAPAILGKRNSRKSLFTSPCSRRCFTYCSPGRISDERGHRVKFSERPYF